MCSDPGLMMWPWVSLKPLVPYLREKMTSAYNRQGCEDSGDTSATHLVQAQAYRVERIQATAGAANGDSPHSVNRLIAPYYPNGETTSLGPGQARALLQASLLPLFFRSTFCFNFLE